MLKFALVVALLSLSLPACVHAQTVEPATGSSGTSETGASTDYQQRELQFKSRPAGASKPSARPGKSPTGGIFGAAIEKARGTSTDTSGRQFWLAGSEVEYAGKSYRIDRVRGSIHLRVRRSQVYRLIKEKRVVKGLRVTD